MPFRYTRVTDPTSELVAEFAAIRAELEVSAEFPADVEAAATAAVSSLALPDADATDVPFVTIDPEGSRDLDQALALARHGDGFVVHYAIADLAAVVAPGGPVDEEARRRGQTLYAPDESVPLHPRVISEDAASLLPDQERSAYVWRFVLDGVGEVVETALTRTRVRSRERLSYAEAQQRIDGGDPHLILLREIGERRIALEAARHGASLDMPEDEVVLRDGTWTIERRLLLPVEQWNAQLSLMTGMEAARLQLSVGRGVLRTMPRPSAEDMTEFRRVSTALGVAWQEDEDDGAYLRRLDRSSPVTVAILGAARRLFRGAGYLVLDGVERGDAATVQAAIGAPYAHTTAPLRRLVDRYVLAHCEAIANGREIPEWATAGLADLPTIMQESGSRAGRLERESLAAVAVAVLEPRVGESFEGIVVERSEKSARVELDDPPIEVSVPGAAGDPGERVSVRLESVDRGERASQFVPE